MLVLVWTSLLIVVMGESGSGSTGMCPGDPLTFRSSYGTCANYRPGHTGSNWKYCSTDMHQNDGNLDGCTNGLVGYEEGCADVNMGLLACQVCDQCHPDSYVNARGITKTHASCPAGLPNVDSCTQ